MRYSLAFFLASHNEKKIIKPAYTPARPPLITYFTVETERHNTHTASVNSLLHSNRVNISLHCIYHDVSR